LKCFTSAVISPLFVHRELRTLTHAELGAELDAAREEKSSKLFPCAHRD